MCLRSGKDLWYLDSGCSRHMSDNASLFIEVKKKECGSVTFGDKGIGKIISVGKIGKNPSNSIDNVYVVDGLKVNILCISQLCDKGNLVTFDSTNCIVRNKKSKKITLHGPRIENVYAIDIDNIASHNLSCFKVTPIEDNWLWHHRLGHASMDTIKKLAKHELVRGLPTCKFEYDHLCDACAKGKQVYSSFKPTNNISTSRPLELLHMDLCGPISIQSLERSKYILVIVMTIPASHGSLF